MADNIELDAGSGGATVATDDDGTAHHQYVKLEAGADGTQTKILAGGGTEDGALRVTVASDSTGVLSVDDNGGSLTVDGTVAVTGVSTAANQTTIIGHVDGIEALLTTIDADTSNLSVVGSGTEATAQRVTIATDSTGVLSVDDNGGSLTVDGTVTIQDGGNTITVDNGGTFAVQADTELTTGDVDTGAGTDTRAVIGLVGTASGGGQLIPGSSTDGLLVNLGGNNDVTVAGVATAANQTTLIGHVDGVEGLLTTIDGDTGTIAGAVSGTEMQVDVVGALPAGNNNIGDVDVASSALPTGAATSANQTTVIGHLDGVEGLLTTIDADTSNLSVVGSGTEATAQRVTIATDSTGVLSVDDNGGSLTVDGTVTANAGTNLNTSALALEAGGNLAAHTTALQIMDDWDESDRAKVNLIVGQAGIAAGTGADGATVPRVTLATNVALPAGTNAIGKLAANSGVDIGDVDVTSISAGTNTIGDVGVKPRTTGGLTIFRSLDLDETEEEVKATAGQVFGWYIFNAAASTTYVKFYNATAANVTVGATTPVLTLPVPAGSAANVFSEIGVAFGTAITVAATTGVADADTGAPAANDIVINVLYS